MVTIKILIDDKDCDYHGVSRERIIFFVRINITRGNKIDYQG